MESIKILKGNKEELNSWLNMSGTQIEIIDIIHSVGAITILYEKI